MQDTNTTDAVASEPVRSGLRRYWIETWGCQMNLYDTDRFAAQLEKLGYTKAIGEADAELILLNTCSIREKAAHKIFSRLGRLAERKREDSSLIVGVAGCVAQQEKEMLLTRSPVADFVVGTKAVGALPGLLEKVRAGRRPVDVSMQDGRFDDIQPTARAMGRRAFVTIVEGCDKSCSFCIVPFTRGKEVNRTPESILTEIQSLVDSGVIEVELLGQNVNAYQHGETSFAHLLRMVDRIPGLRRLRFTTSHPRELTDEVVDTMAATETVCDHLHLPVQSGSTNVLKRMYRGYDRERYISRIKKLRTAIPSIALSTDIIVGFPGETAEEFEETMTLIDQVEFDQVFAFIYSPRPHTRAAELEDPTPLKEKEERLQRLLARQDVISRRKNEAYIGKTVSVLVHGPSKRDPAVLNGRTTDNTIVNFAADAADCHGIVDVTIDKAYPHSLVGTLSGR